MTIYSKSFEELTCSELYAILQLRSEVFVVEQDCAYLDMDGKDQKALHVIGKKEGNIIGYARLFKAGDYFEHASVGRIVVSASERRYGYGHDIVKEAIKIIQDIFGERIIEISAQSYLKKFYEVHGFLQIGEDYLEDGIPHLKMIRG
jgi:ElaA protein